MLSQNLEFHIIIVVQCILATINENALGTIRIRVGRIVNLQNYDHLDIQSMLSCRNSAYINPRLHVRTGNVIDHIPAK